MPPITEKTSMNLAPDIYAWDESEIDQVFYSYVRIGDEVIGLVKGKKPGIIYTKF